MIAKKDIPNLLTYARVAAVPLCLILILLNPTCKATALFWIFVAASITDFLDGYLARKWNAVSPIGALLDPIADKLLVALMLVYLTTISSSAKTVFGASSIVTLPLFLPAAIIILRELYISGLREFLAARQIALLVSKGGKWKTALQMIALTLILAHYAFEPTNVNCPSPNIPGIENDIAWQECPTRLYISELCDVWGNRLLHIAALLAVTSAISYTRASWKHLRTVN